MDLPCHVCGHDADYHNFIIPDPKCSKCPGGICTPKTPVSVENDQLYANPHMGDPKQG